MTCGVYRIRNIADGKAYIGSSRNIERRWRAHLGLLKRGCHRNSKLQEAFDSFGEELFEMTAIQITSPDNLLSAEQRCIDAYRASSDGYNIAKNSRGGGRPSHLIGPSCSLCGHEKMHSAGNRWRCTACGKQVAKDPKPRGGYRHGIKGGTTGAERTRASRARTAKRGMNVDGAIAR